MEFLQGGQIIKAIKSLTSEGKSQGEPLNIAVAYWGKNAIEETGLQKRIERNPANVRVICDLMGGACNPSPIAKLRRLGTNVKTSDGMHAKVWVRGDSVIVGSANVSANGLGFDDKGVTIGNHEAAVLIHDGRFAESVNSWFDELWENDGEFVNDDHIDWARNRWQIRKNSGDKKPVSSRTSLLQRVRELKASNKGFENVKVLVYENGEYSNPVEKYLESDALEEHFPLTALSQASSRRSCWECFDKSWRFEIDDVYLDFSYPQGTKTGLKFNGIWRIVSPSGEFTKVGDSYIVLCLQEIECDGYVFGRSDQNEIKRMIRRCIEEMDWETDKAGWLVDMRLRKFVTNFDESPASNAS